MANRVGANGPKLNIIPQKQNNRPALPEHRFMMCEIIWTNSPYYATFKSKRKSAGFEGGVLCVALLIACIAEGRVAPSYALYKDYTAGFGLLQHPMRM